MGFVSVWRRRGCECRAESGIDPPVGDVVVLVNGTWGEHASWMQPGAPLPAELEKSGVAVRRFCWSGKNSHLSRLDAARRLRKLLAGLVEEDGGRLVDVVAHSHGGNLALYALDDDRWNDDTVLDQVRVATLATPFLIARADKRWWRILALLSPFLAWLAVFFVAVVAIFMTIGMDEGEVAWRFAYGSLAAALSLSTLMLRSWMSFRRSEDSLRSFATTAMVLVAGALLASAAFFLVSWTVFPSWSDSFNESEGLVDQIRSVGVPFLLVLVPYLLWFAQPMNVEPLGSARLGGDSDEIASGITARDPGAGRVAVFRAVGDEASAGLLGSHLLSFAAGRAMRFTARLSLAALVLLCVSLLMFWLVSEPTLRSAGLDSKIFSLFLISMTVFGSAILVGLMLFSAALVGASLFGVEGPYLLLRMSLLADY